MVHANLLTLLKYDEPKQNFSRSIGDIYYTVNETNLAKTDDVKISHNILNNFYQLNGKLCFLKSQIFVKILQIMHMYA